MADPFDTPGYRFALNRFPGDGVTTLWDISFAGVSPGYIIQDHVRAVLVDDTTGVETPIILTPANFVLPTRLEITPAVPVGVTLEVRRNSPKDEPLLDYTDGALMIEKNLDTSNQQTVYAVAEMVDRFADALDETAEFSQAVLDRLAEVETTANDAAADAATAVSTANAAAADAATAVATSAEALAGVEGAEEAALLATAAADAANAAATLATDAAVSALATAASAEAIAQDASDVANGIAGTANAALDAAEAAVITADAAEATANAIDGKAQDALDASAAAVADASAAVAAAAAAIPLTQKGAASGVATLDSGSKVPLAQMPVFQHGQVRLTYVSTSTLRLMPQDGGGLIVNGAQMFVPQAGVDFTTGSTTAGGSYYLYAYNNSGSIAIEGSATAPAWHTNGVRVKTGDASRTLVGWASTSGSNQFVYSLTDKRVLSWFNRRRRHVREIGGTSTTSSTSSVQLTAGINIACWSGEEVTFSLTGEVHTLAAIATGIYVSVRIGPIPLEYGNWGYSAEAYGVQVPSSISDSYTAASDGNIGLSPFGYTNTAAAPALFRQTLIAHADI